MTFAKTKPFRGGAEDLDVVGLEPGGVSAMLLRTVTPPGIVKNKTPRSSGVRRPQGPRPQAAGGVLEGALAVGETVFGGTPLYL